MKVSEIHRQVFSELKLGVITSIFDVMRSKNINELELKLCITINESNDVLKQVNLEKQSVLISSYNYFEQPITELDILVLLTILEEIEKERYTIEEEI